MLRENTHSVPHRQNTFGETPTFKCIQKIMNRFAGVVFLPLLLLWQVFRGGEVAHRPSPGTRGLAVYGAVRPAIFMDGPDSLYHNESFNFDHNGNENGGKSALIVTGPPGRSVFAHLLGSRRERFGCRFDEIAAGRYICRHSELVPAGSWDVRVVLARAPRAEAPAGFCSAGIRDPGTVLTLGDYLHRTNILRASEFSKCFDPSYVDVLNGTFVSTTPKNRHRHLLPRCQGTPGPGLWIPSSSSPEEDIVKHDFVPLTCELQTFTEEEVVSCIKARRPVFFGDSRFMQLGHSLATYVGSHVGSLGYSTSSYPIFPLIFRLGLALLYPDQPELPFPPMPYNADRFRDELANDYESGHQLLFSSLLHDLASFDSNPNPHLNATAQDVRQFYGSATCPLSCTGPLIGNCTLCREKVAPLDRYLTNVKRLLQEYPATWRRKPIWIPIGKRPPVPTDKDHFEWQDHATLSAIQDAAAKVVQGTQWRHVDLTGFEDGTATEWWMDQVHWEWNLAKMLRHGVIGWMMIILMDTMC